MGAGDQCSFGCERCISRLKLSDDIIIFSLEVQLELILEIEIGECVVVDRQFEFLSDLCIHLQLGVHVEIKSPVTSCPFRQGGVADVLPLIPGQKINVTGRFDIDLHFAIRTGSHDAIEPVVRNPKFRFVDLSIHAEK